MVATPVSKRVAAAARVHGLSKLDRQLAAMNFALAAQHNVYSISTMMGKYGLKCLVHFSPCIPPVPSPAQACTPTDGGVQAQRTSAKSAPPRTGKPPARSFYGDFHGVCSHLALSAIRDISLRHLIFCKNF